jgi:nucleoid-associated protein YgaU
MNRETKIGLLTGLALIILAGALLSNYLSRPRQDQGSAMLNNMDQQLRQGLDDSDVVPPAPDTSGQNILPGDTGTNSAAPIPANPNTTAQNSSQSSAASLTPASTGAGPIMPNANNQHQTMAAAPVNFPLNVPQTTMVADDGGSLLNNVIEPQSNTPAQNVYSVVAGDTLSRIARKFYHNNSTAAMDRIIRANPGKLTSLESTLHIAETLVIPSVAAPQGGNLAVQNSSLQADSISIPDGDEAANHSPASANETPTNVTMYQVKHGDTLSSIARRFLGSASKANIKLIVQLNHIHDASSLMIGQTLQIPSR